MTVLHETFFKGLHLPAEERARKLAFVEKRLSNKQRLVRISQALAAIRAELLEGMEAKRRAGQPYGSREERLLEMLRSARADLDALEL
jgi:hypothetical protein